MYYKIYNLVSEEREFVCIYNVYSSILKIKLLNL